MSHPERPFVRMASIPQRSTHTAETPSPVLPADCRLTTRIGNRASDPLVGGALLARKRARLLETSPRSHDDISEYTALGRLAERAPQASARTEICGKLSLS
jgi:hypothetical protein